MNWYIVPVNCPVCTRQAEIKKVSYSAREIKITAWCPSCAREVFSILEMDALRAWAHHRDNPFPTPDDLKFLKNMNVVWANSKG